MQYNSKTVAWLKKLHLDIQEIKSGFMMHRDPQCITQSHTEIFKLAQHKTDLEQEAALLCQHHAVPEPNNPVRSLCWCQDPSVYLYPILHSLLYMYSAVWTFITWNCIAWRRNTQISLFTVQNVMDLDMQHSAFIPLLLQKLLTFSKTHYMATGFHSV